MITMFNQHTTMSVEKGSEAPVTTTTVKTLLKGDIEVEDHRIVTLTQPLFGFEHIERFILFQTKEGPMYWLQGLEDVNAAFCVLAPFVVGLDIDIPLTSKDLEDLGTDSVENIIVYTMVVLNEDPSETCTNLRAPILVCADSGKAKQIILDDQALPLRFRLAELAKPPGKRVNI